MRWEERNCILRCWQIRMNSLQMRFGSASLGGLNTAQNKWSSLPWYLTLTVASQRCAEDGGGAYDNALTEQRVFEGTTRKLCGSNGVPQGVCYKLGFRLPEGVGRTSDLVPVLWNKHVWLAGSRYEEVEKHVHLLTSTPLLIKCRWTQSHNVFKC